MSKPREHILTFAGAGQRDIQAAGRFVRVMETPVSDVFVSIDNASELQMGAGQQVHDADGFKKITIRTTVAQTVRVVTADSPIDDNRSNVALSVSTTVAGSTAATKQAVVSVGAGATVQLVAANANRQEVRLAIPADQPGGVWFSDSVAQAADEGGWLDAGMVDYPATTAALYARNPHATLAVLVSVLDLESP